MTDDTSFTYSEQNFDLTQIEINNDLEILDQWAKTWLVHLEYFFVVAQSANLFSRV